MHDEATLRLLAAYADSLRRIAKAEADFYEANIERRLRATGLDEPQLIKFGTRLGNRVNALLERALLQLYRRHRGARRRGRRARRRAAGLAGQ